MPKGSAAFFFRSCKMLRIPQSYIDELLEGDWALHDVTTEGMGLKGEYVVTAWPKETGIVAGILFL